ncbi:MAG: NAD-dependent epimerase/dehydratase family protein, partial [Solirubrobacteraceae bacterium]
MSVVLVTGGTGTLGTQLVAILRERGHDVRVLSRRRGAGTHVGDLKTGEGVAAAAAGAELVVHAASDARSGRSDAQQTGRLLTAVRDARHTHPLAVLRAARSLGERLAAHSRRPHADEPRTQRPLDPVEHPSHPPQHMRG